MKRSSRATTLFPIHARTPNNCLIGGADTGGGANNDLSVDRNFQRRKLRALEKWRKEAHRHTVQSQADDAEDWEMFRRFKLGELEEWRSLAFEAHELDLMTEDYDKEFISSLPEYNDSPWDLDYNTVFYDSMDIHVYMYHWDWDDSECLPALPIFHVLKGAGKSDITTCPHLDTLDSRCHRESCQFRIKAPTFTFETYHRRQIAFGFLGSTPMEDIEYYDYMNGWSPLQTVPVLSKKHIFIIRRRHEENHDTNFAHLGLTELVREMETRSGLPHRRILPDASPYDEDNQVPHLVDSNWITISL